MVVCCPYDIRGSTELKHHRFEEEQIRRYIRSQEQLETEGEDEDGEF
jgi:hypothetical protein